LPNRTLFLVVFAIAFLALSWNIWNVGIASGYIDSVKKLGAQDESVYTREAIHMATRGDWMTMTYLDRFVLFKPPLLMWLSGISAKLLGINRFALRLPSLIAGSLACLFAFLITKRAGWAAVILLLSDRLFHTLSRVNMTDMVLCACIVAAFYFFLRDPPLHDRLSFWGFTVSCACAILDKSIAGVLPFAVTLVFLLLYRGENRPSFWRLVQAGIVAVAIVLPWHLYQYFVHYDWFLAEYLGVQLLAFGGKPPQTSQENQFLFYGSRLWLSDPIIAILTLLTIPVWFKKRSEALAVLLFAWVLIFGGALVIFQYRSLQYLLPLIPALAIAIAAYCPGMNRRAVLVALCAVFIVKAVWPDRLWGNTYAGGSTLALAAPLTGYCEQHRPNDLFILDSDDEFYSSVLPITRVRYGWADPADAYLLLEPHLRYLGILLQPSEFFDLPAKEPAYRERLKQWGILTDKPIATAIAAHVPADFLPIVASRPGSDFLLPRGLVPHEAFATHDVREAAQDRVFLISKQPKPEVWIGPRWSCRL
jgi:4-amino-4-deoxy-L-arabinose transferase-like glycosyltransferase